MKALKKCFLSLACLSILTGSAIGAGCNGKTYEVYTNIPDGGFEITDDSFRLGGIIGGYSPTDTGGGGTVDTSNYSAKGQAFLSLMFTDAQIVVHDDFGEDAKKDDLNEFTTEAGKKFVNFTKEVGQVLREISKIASATVTGSDVYNFNNAAAGATVEVSETAYRILSEAKAVYEFTEGYYNPALYYNVLAYGFGSAANYPDSAADFPADEDVAKYTDLAGHFADLTLSQAEDRYFVTKPEYTVEVGGETLSLKLDLGGISKGYAVDVVDGLFDKYGYEFGYFNFGESSMLVKRHFSNENFNLFFGGPRSLTHDGYFKIKIKNEKLSTSGDNEQYYTIGGTRYCHIIDPTTGKPVQTGIMSATVIGGSAASADAITTAIMAMGKDKAVSFIEEKLTDRKVVFTCE